MLRVIAAVFGLILIALGAVGFVPMLNPDNQLFGVFNSNLPLNLLHLITGVIALLVGLISEDKSALFFQLFGIVYGLLALLGVYYVEENILGLFASNMANAGLHLAIAAISLYLGFLYSD